MDVNVVKDILKAYSIKKAAAEEKSKSEIKKLFESIPEAQKLQEQLAEVSIKSLKNNIGKSKLEREIESQNLEIKINEINDKINKILIKNGYNKDVFNPNYECLICKDTGYIGSTQCKCLKQNIINVAYKQSNVLKLEEENFETFDIGYYSSKPDPKYGTDKSPLENIEEIRKISKRFSENMEDKNQKNLLFIGKTGIGKTFLSNCIAAEVIKKGYTSIYQTAPVLMDTVIEYKLSYGKSENSRRRYNQIFETDLLIIDDLGTENMNNIKFTELFNIINTRLLNNKKMIISTNLTIKELYATYDERVVSRLIGNFIVCRFIGEDIRLKKKKIN